MILDQQIDAIVRAGVFSSREKAMDAAVQTLFAVKPQLRTEAAIELFRSGEVSLARAAEIAGLDTEGFRELLSDRAIPETIEADSSEEMDRRIAIFLK